MKVAYLLHWNEGETSGVFKKVVSQVNTWRSLGVQVVVHVVSREAIYDTWRHYLRTVPCRYYQYGTWWDRIRIWRTVEQGICDDRPDVVYHRYELYAPGIASLAAKLPVILEINSDDIREYCTTGRARCLYNRLTRGLLLSKIAGFVFISEELSARNCFQRFGKKYTVIGNAIELAETRVLAAPQNKSPHLIFLASSAQPWLGIDKVVRMARAFPDWVFHVVGPELGFVRAVPRNIVCHGRLSRQCYEPLLAKADVAIGTLALHRIGMNEGSPLKVREYLAYGLPVIIGYRDTDFPEGASFLLELPNTEDNVERMRNEIYAFVRNWMGRRVPRECIEHLDVKVKEQTRLSFFREVIETRKK